ncbi:Wzz/FepE/Etk N-terminal domain-containing protein [Sporosarcina luteola]|uniref:Wzz/FepE/Etk N-terminal domain-containing protein n=1 Tax=Sporosarcina luteola TaxID=582850 RepID=UPI0020420360|nr:Wzz/FepE/Etk N-terminal domain-containing protein [Sporosarcina luteola]MCM3636537.1 Wzz/FepE/Etk N-terminal domain-containing protein [Sporosarcina luteola]
MEETIELRELIETVWKGKWIIAGLTALCVFIAAIVSWSVLPEEYESKATVQVASEVQDAGIMASYVAAEFTPVIFTQRIKNPTLMDEALEEAGIKEKFDVERLSVNTQANTNLVELKYTAFSPEVAQQELTIFIQKTKERMNVSVKSTLDELEKTYTSESKHLSGEIEALVGKYNEKIATNGLPEILIMQTLIGSQIITPVTEEQMNALSRVDGTLHNELMQMQAQIASKSAEYRKVLDKYQSVKTGLDSFRPDPFIRQIVDPTLPERPFAPSKSLNVAIAMTIGLLAGVGIVVFREYWKNSAPVK